MEHAFAKKLFRKILENARAYLPEADLLTLKKAYICSRHAHHHQKRENGQLYITHPLSVAEHLSELHLDTATLVAGLLHDVLEDTPTTRSELEQAFGPEITHIVEGVTKIDSLEEIHFDPSSDQSSTDITRQAENWRKMLIATAQDIRVILVKLADRLHNMETLEYLSPERQKHIAEETLTLYAPLAHRLGISRLKSGLQNLSYKYVEPEVYAELEKKLEEGKAQREAVLKISTQQIESALSQTGIPYRIFSRPKGIYSLHKKMVRQNKTFEEIQDLAGIRILTDTVEHCYGLLGIVHNQFTPIPGSFDDYIAMPKLNFYQSLHTAVMLGKGETVEIQIRTEDMHRIAEYGVAAHWKYKQRADKGKTASGRVPQKTGEDMVESKLDWLKQILEWQQETSHPKEFMEGIKVELEFDQVFVFTPKGEVKKLPMGSTPVDFAYAVHSDLGNQCIGAKINDKMGKLDTPLKSGDRCTIIIRKGQTPHKDWLDFVKTPRARSKIRKFFRDKESQKRD